MSNRFQILLVSPEAKTIIEPWLMQVGNQAHIIKVSSLQKALRHLQRKDFDAIIYRVRAQSRTNLDHLETLHKAAPKSCLMALLNSTQYADGLADKAMRSGVSEFLISEELTNLNFSRIVRIGIQRKKLSIGKQSPPVTSTSDPFASWSTTKALGISRKKQIRLCLLTNNETNRLKTLESLAGLPLKIWTYTNLDAFSQESRALMFDLVLLVHVSSSDIASLPDIVRKNLKSSTILVAGDHSAEVQSLLSKDGFSYVQEFNSDDQNQDQLCQLGFASKERRIYQDLRQEILSKRRLKILVVGFFTYQNELREILEDIDCFYELIQESDRPSQPFDLIITELQAIKEQFGESTKCLTIDGSIPFNKKSLLQGLLECLKESS